MLSVIRGHRPKLWIAFAGVALPLVAGAVDGMGLSLVGFFSSHMTGNTARLGNELDARHWGAVLAIASGIGSFLIGAAVSAVVMELPGRLFRRRFATAFAIEAALLSVASWLVSPRFGATPVVAFSCLLCLAMGIQNGVTSRISGLVVRTTHMTGVLTDIGLALGRKLLGADVAADQTQSGMLHVLIYGSFLVGGATGAGLVRLLGWRAPLVPVFVLVALAAVDALVLLQPTIKERPAGV